MIHVDIWKEAQVPGGRNHQTEEVEMVWTCAKAGSDKATKQLLQMTVDGKRHRGRPKLRWRDLVKQDIARSQLTTETAEDSGMS